MRTKIREEAMEDEGGNQQRTGRNCWKQMRMEWDLMGDRLELLRGGTGRGKWREESWGQR